MSRKIVQLGYGRMGETVLADLLGTARFDELVVADARSDLSSRIADLGDPRVRSVSLNVDDRDALLALIEGADVVVELLPLGYPRDPTAVQKNRLPLDTIVHRENW